MNVTENRKQLAAAATRKSLETRKKFGCSLWDAICVFDLAERIGLEVRFWDIPSMEGIYYRADAPSVIVSSLRPPGRQAFTCAHEIGHHVFNHGEQFDELIEERKEARRFDPCEYQADIFAEFLLMPKGAVTRALSVRDLTADKYTPETLYAVSTWFGVGYSTFVNHMSWTLLRLDQ